jgi:putative inorganic carbon (HCO3(-)) transporter
MVDQVSVGSRGRLEILVPSMVGCGLGLVAAVAASHRSPQALLMVLVVIVPFGIALLGDLRRVMLGIALLDIPFQWDKLLGYRGDVPLSPDPNGWVVSATTIALVVLYTTWTAELLASRDSAPAPRLRTAAVPLVFVLLLVASVSVAPDRTAAGFQIATYAQALLLFVYVASTVRTRKDVSFVVGALLVGLCLESLVTMAMFATNGRFQIPGTATESIPAVTGDSVRVGGTIGSPNMAGSYFAFMSALSAAVFLSRVPAPLKGLALAGCGLGLVALVLTLSRGAWIACLVSIAVLVYGSGGRRLSPPAVAAVALVLVVAIVPLGGVISSRLVSSDQGAAESRVPLIRMAGRMIEDHPLLGVGANNFTIELPKYAGGEFSTAWLAPVHNKNLLIWSEAGPAALIAFLVFVGMTIIRGLRLREASDPLFGAVGLGLAAAVAGNAVHMNFDRFAYGTTTAMLWVAAGVLAAPVFEPWTGHVRPRGNRF